LLEGLRLREGWSSLVLLLLALLTVAWSFEAGGLADELRILPDVVILGTLVGFVGAKTRIPGLLAHPLGLVIGAIVCLLLLSPLIPLPPNLEPTGTGLAGWLAELQIKGQMLWQRMDTWLAAALGGQASADPLPFVVQMAGLSWLLAFYGAWFLFRTHWVWGAVLPAGLTIFLSVYYAPPRLLIYFVLYLILSLILIVRANVYRHEHEWQRHRVVYDPHVGIEFMRGGAVLALAVVVLIWLIPRPHGPAQLGEYWRRLEGPWQRVQEEWQRLYASLGYRDQPAMRSIARTLTLGGAVDLGSALVMEVRAGEPRYWRAVAMDRYTGTGWADSSTAALHVAAGTPLGDWTAFRARKLLVQTVRLQHPGDSLLFAAAEPLQVQLVTRVHGTLRPEGFDPLEGEGFDLTAIYAQRLEPDNQYVVRSLVSVATIRNLRNAGTSYPAWVTARYLQLPGSLPQRVRDLAREVAGDQATPFDQAVAIESFLREYAYNQSIDAPPAGRDPVDWFLFDYKEGYCTYYASAMALMCRALGVPARFAQGYAAGEYNPERGTYVVREADAHAWVEVFFPGYGWAEFEPTPSQPLIIRATGEDEARPSDPPLPLPPGGELEEHFGPDLLLPPEGELGDLLLPGQQAMARRTLLLHLLAAGLLAAAVAGLAWRYGGRWWRLRPAERLYLCLTATLGALGVRAYAWQTPLELGRALADALGSRGELALEIVRLYVRDRFGRRPATGEELAAAEAAWRQLRPVILLQAAGRLPGPWQRRRP
jgi:hypothetical protein